MDVALLHAVVDRVLHEQQADHRAGGAEHRDQRQERDAQALAAAGSGEAAEPGALRGKQLVSEESLELAVAREELRRRALLDDTPSDEHDGAVGDLHGREALRRDEHGPAGDAPDAARRRADARSRCRRPRADRRAR